MVRSLKRMALGWICGIALAVSASAVSAADYIAWATHSIGGNPTVVVGYGPTETDACNCVKRITGEGTPCQTVQVPYTVPDCPHSDPGNPGSGSPTVEYNVVFKAANNPFGTTFNVKMPKDAAGSNYFKEVFAPITSRLVALEIAKKYSWGEITTFSLEPVPPPGPGVPGTEDPTVGGGLIP